MRNPTAPVPANLPANAAGFVCVRPDRRERLAYYSREGQLGMTFAQDETLDDIRPIFARDGRYTMDSEGFMFPVGGEG